MSLLETLILTLGAEIGKTLLRVWLKDEALLERVSETSVDWLKKRIGDILSARRAARQFDNLGDKIAKNLLPVFKNSNLDDRSCSAIAEDVANAIASARITSRLLAELSYNPTALLAHIKKEHFPRIDLSENERILYYRALDLASQYIVDLAPNLPEYTSINFAQILGRLDLLMQNLEAILDDLDKLRVASHSNDQSSEFADFECDYRALVVRKLDRIDLFGADLSRRTKRYQLSIAYVSLAFINRARSHKRKTYEYESTNHVDVQAALTKDSIDKDKPNEKKRSVSKTAIIGDAGTGKTTLLYWLAINSAGNLFEKSLSEWRNTVPFIIELRRYGKDLPGPQHFIDKIAFEIADRMPKDWVQHTLESGRAILLIDGLDEVPKSNREGVYDWLDAICNQYEKTRIVFTSRPASYEYGRLSRLGFKEFELAPMQADQIDIFIAHWHNAVLCAESTEDPGDVKSIYKKLIYKVHNSLPLYKLASNPLLCAMLCALHYERNMQLPADRSDLYEACCSMLLERRDSEREIDSTMHPKLSYKQKRIVLDDLAYWMMKNQYISADKWQVYPRIQQKLVNMQLPSSFSDTEVISYLVERSGIIRDTTPDSIDFIHRTFQEYMAASAATIEEDWGFLLDHASDDQWHETIILAAGFSNKQQADFFVGALLDKGRKSSYVRHKYDLLAISCLETIVEISPEVRDKVEKRIHSLIPPKRHEDRKPIAAAGDLAVPYLDLKDSYTSEDAVACIMTLQMIGSPSAFSQALDYLRMPLPPVLNEIFNFLDFYTPKEIDPKDTERLLSFVAHSVTDHRLYIHGKVLRALSGNPFSAIDESTKKSIMQICLDLSLSPTKCELGFTHLLPESEELIIKGLPQSLDGLNHHPSLRVIDLRFSRRNSAHPSMYGSDSSSFQWPSLRSLHLIPNLGLIRIFSNDIWPDFADLHSFGRPVSLAIMSLGNEETDYRLMESISGINELVYIHLAGYLSIDLAPLGKLRNLETLEISTEAGIDGIYGFDCLQQIKSLLINVPRIADIQQTSVDQIGVFCSNCIVSINEVMEENCWWSEYQKMKF